MVNNFEGPQSRIEGMPQLPESTPAARPIRTRQESELSDQNKLVEIKLQSPSRPPRSVPDPEGQATIDRLETKPLSAEERAFGAEQARQMLDKLSSSSNETPK